MTASKREEIDAWWGSYSIKSFLPGMLAAIIVSGGVVVGIWFLPLGGWEKLTIWSIFGLAWIMLLLYWAYRGFCCTYRLTTHRLFLETGPGPRRVEAVELSKIRQVFARSNWMERLLGIGRVVVEVESPPRTMILKGLAAPESIVEKIRHLKSQVT